MYPSVRPFACLEFSSILSRLAPDLGRSRLFFFCIICTQVRFLFFCQNFFYRTSRNQILNFKNSSPSICSSVTELQENKVWAEDIIKVNLRDLKVTRTNLFKREFTSFKVKMVRFYFCFFFLNSYIHHYLMRTLRNQILNFMRCVALH